MMKYDDFRPCEMDVFVGRLFDEVDDPYDRSDAITDWLEGDWSSALEWLKPETRAMLEARK